MQLWKECAGCSLLSEIITIANRVSIGVRLEFREKFYARNSKIVFDIFVAFVIILETADDDYSYNR